MQLDRLHVARTLLVTLPLLAACGSGNDTPDPERIAVTITSVTPAEGFAPAEVDLEGAVEALVDSVDLADVTLTWDFGDGDSATGESVIHTFDDPGTYTITLTAEERDGDSVRGESVATTTVIALEPADLNLSTPALTPSALHTGEALRIALDLVNDGASIPEGHPFDIGYFLADEGLDATGLGEADALDAAVDAGTLRELHRVTLPSMEAGARQNIDEREVLFPDDVLTGNYVVLAVADPDGVIGETDRTNNAKVSTITVAYTNDGRQGPDLAVRNVAATPSRVNVLTEVNVDAELHNLGTEAALLFDYNVYLSFGDAELDEEDLLLATEAVDNVPSADVLELETTYVLDTEITALGSYYVIIEADATGAVDETNEQNNVGTTGAPIIVTDEAIPGVDIVITALEVLPAITFLEGSVELRATVENTGVDPIERQFLCRAYLSEDDDLDATPGGDQLLESLTIPPLDAAGVHEISRVADIPSFFEVGEFYVLLYCDASQSIEEASEDNNVRATDEPLTIRAEAAVDLLPGLIAINPLTLNNGELTTVTAEVCNNGANGSTPSIVRVYLSEDDEFDFSDTLLMQSNVPPIDGEACLTIEGSVPAVCDTFVSDYHAIFIVDATDVVPERSESNNVEVLDEMVTIEGLICACEPDTYERNNTPGTAALLEPSASPFLGLSMCDQAEDWYRIPLLRGETIRASATFEHDRGDLNMVLYGTDFATVLARSETSGDREEVAYFRVPERGDYLLGVVGPTLSDRNVYDLEIDVSTPDAGQDLTVMAVSTSTLTPVLGEEITVDFELVNLGDTPVDTPSVARILLTADTSVDPIEDIVLAQVDVPAVEDRVLRSERVALPTDIEGGRYYIAVVADARNDVTGELSETNNTALSPQIGISASCYDTLEPNNSLDAPRTLTLVSEPPVTLGGLLVCADNRDFYELCVSDGDYLNFTVRFPNDLGDVDAKLYNGAGAEIAHSEGTGPEESVGVDFVSGDQCYRLEVYVSNPGAEVPYELDIDTGRAPDELQCNNAAEPNGGFDTAAPLRDWIDEDLAVCPDGDEDHFVITLTAGTELSLRLLPAEGETEVPDALRIRLSGPSENFLANTVRADETLTYTTTVGGRHYVRVRSSGDGPRNQPYRLEVEGISGTDLMVSDLLLSPAMTAAGEQVRYDFLVSNTRDTASIGTRYHVYLSEDPALDGEDWLLRNLALAPIEGLSQRYEGAKITLPEVLTLGGTYYVIVVVDPDDLVDELQERNNTVVEPITLAAGCVFDEAEPNAFPLDAADALAYVGAPLTICPDDEDWFYVDLEAGERATIDITFATDDGDLDLYAYNPAGSRVALSDSNTDDEHVTFVASSAGRYTFLVNAFDAATASAAYDLALTVE